MARKALEPNLWTINETFRHMYSVPVYQRPYSWEQTQITVFLDDIINVYRLPDNDREEGYFIGSIYIHDRGDKLKGLIQKYEIIDGQQRLTTLALLLLSIYSQAIVMGVPESDQTLLEVKKALWKYVDRNYVKQNRAVTLNSIEKKCFEDLYDNCFLKPEGIIDFCDQYSSKNRFEKRVLDNFRIIHKRILTEYPECCKDDLLNFADYLLNYVQIIAIDSTCSISKAFSIFESINSKGKPLDEIDKIKTYIFSLLDESSYDYYLDLWGQLIIETNDQLYDYLYTYIKAYISFYRSNIYVDNFKLLCKREIPAYFNKPKTEEAIKALLDDMKKKVVYYKILSDVTKANELVKSNEFRFFYAVFTLINYKHPKALFLRCIEEFANGKMTKPDLIKTIRETVKFMVMFLTISNRDSKDAISMFSTIMNDVYRRTYIDAKVIVNIISNELLSKAVTSERVKESLASIDAYEQNNKIAVTLLALYESTNIDESGNAKISYDKAFTLLSNYGSTFSLDHLLVQSPEVDSPFQYYRDENNNLVLKEHHDFDASILSGMDYDLFTRTVLNKIGNLRLWYKDDNSVRQNDAVQLNDYSGFVTYSQIQQRGKNIVDTLFDSCLPMPVYDPSIKLTADISESALPSMGKMLEYGLINIGDRICLSTDPEGSEATLIDEFNVEYKGQLMRINAWGCLVTGWKSIRIYSYCSIVGENETLHQKRLKYIANHNEETFG